MFKISLPPKLKDLVSFIANISMGEQEDCTSYARSWGKHQPDALFGLSATGVGRTQDNTYDTLVG